MPVVLDIGCGDSNITLPPHYAGWERVRLDIDPGFCPNILLDARELHRLPPATFDAAYCAHNLEHFHRHDAIKVLLGMRHVLKDDGFAEIRVPDLGAVFSRMSRDNLDIDDLLYQSHRGPILVRDVIFGYHVEIEQTGQDFYAHKTGFTVKSLSKIFSQLPFERAIVATPVEFNIVALAFCSRPTPQQLQLLAIPAHLGD